MADGPDRIETRELAYFAAVAEELHFGRAAARLGIAQPPLSRAIQRLERRLGVLLLERTPRGVTLTGPGEVLLREARRALEAVDAAVRRTRRAGAGTERIVLVMKPGGDGGLLPAILDAYEAAEPDPVPVEVMMCGIGERGRALRDGSADAGLLHTPYEDLTGFDTEELVTEGQVLIVPRGHRLAGRGHVTLADLDGERLFDRERDGMPEAGHLMQMIALGRVAMLAPESVADHLRRDLVCVPVPDAPAVTVVIAWPERTRSPAVAALVRAAGAAAAGGAAAGRRVRG
ncbi:LysR family transcriptional regulator [Actinomadura rugatobispora]|uniref:LysR family transcriptional regulator n=1 Tax=Actinomadura rugatobispora TaxID=1994 RepID=A0ABW0ZVT9_9ACTN|nr:LysR family transcriptional regulator [Actinomadura rugatobispora]